MKTVFILAALLGSFLSSRAQAWFPLSHPLSVSGTAVTDTQRNGLFYNPALSSGLEHISLVMEYDSRYSITELAAKGLRFSYPFRDFVTSVDFRRAGFDAYHEMLSGISFSRVFGEKISAGLQFILDSKYAVENNRYYHAFYPQAGLTVLLTPALLLGFSVYNPFLVEMNYEMGKRSIPSVYSLGLKVKLSETVHFRIQADQEISNDLRWGTACDFLLVENISIQTGVHYHDFFVPAVGAGFSFKQLRFDLAVAIHPLLGLTVAGGLSYHFFKR
jgi:hypothetical protein